MQLYTDDGQYCHQARFVLAEKGVGYATKEAHTYADEKDLHDELAKLNPQLSFPTLVDQETVLSHPFVILEYLEERFPYPALLPSPPGERAQVRERIVRVQRHLCEPAQVLLNGTRKATADKTRDAIRQYLISDFVRTVSDGYQWCFSNEFDLLDCYVAPFLWRLSVMGIELNPNKRNEPLLRYMSRVFQRTAFLASLTAAERDMR